jgi:hypothetical protein
MHKFYLKNVSDNEIYIVLEEKGKKKIKIYYSF